MYSIFPKFLPPLIKKKKKKLVVRYGAKVVGKYFPIIPVSIQFRRKATNSSVWFQRITIKAIMVGRCCISFPESSVVYNGANNTLTCQIEETLHISQWFSEELKETTLRSALQRREIRGAFLWAPRPIHDSRMSLPPCMQRHVIGDCVFPGVVWIMDRLSNMNWMRIFIDMDALLVW